MTRPDAQSVNAILALKSLLGQRLSVSKSDLDLHGRSESYFSHCAPDAVAYPETTEEVSLIVKSCADHNVPVVAWGAGTSLEGHALAVKGGVVVDFARMNRVLHISAEDMTVTVQPGLTREALDDELRATGLYFPVDPGANATFGGMTATRASGTTTVQYGSMRENVLALEIVLADGRVVRTGSRARKSSAGYDLTGLMVGSEGTLGLISELTLRLRGQPEAISTGVCAFPNMGAAVAAVTDTVQSGLQMARIEFLDAASVAAVNAYSGMDFQPMPHILVEFHGSQGFVEEQVRHFGQIATDHGAMAFEWSARPEARKTLWAMRHNAYYAILATRKGARAVVTDICVPISRLVRAIEETQADLANATIPGPILGHVGDGNFHAVLLVNEGDPRELAEAKALAHRMTERALALGGTSTGEHGIGFGKLAYMQAEHGGAWSIMGDIKRALDPKNILNPGKIVPQER